MAIITLMMVAVNTSETSVNLYKTTQHNIPEDRPLNTGPRENLKFSHAQDIVTNVSDKPVITTECRNRKS
jgi:hypothetical protein